jgi:dimethylargininase
MTTAFVRRPGPLLPRGILTHIVRTEVDYPKALEQWHAYVEVLASNGWNIEHVHPADDCPDAVFIEDTVVVFDDVAVITRPGADERRPEIAGTEDAIRSHFDRIERIKAPATLDGGDICKVGSTVYVGMSQRTSAGAVDQLAWLLPDREVIPVPITKVLHLKSALTALPDGTIIGYEPVVDDPSLFPRFLAVPEESGSAVVDLGGGRVLMSADCPDSVELVQGRGYDAVTVDISEFQKLEGCVTCLSVRMRV